MDRGLIFDLQTEHERELAEAKSQAEAKAKTDTLAVCSHSIRE